MLFSFRFLFLVGKGDRDFFAGFGPAPNGKNEIPLKHHMISEYRGQLDLGL